MQRPAILILGVLIALSLSGSGCRFDNDMRPSQMNDSPRAPASRPQASVFHSQGKAETLSPDDTAKLQECLTADVGAAALDAQFMKTTGLAIYTYKRDGCTADIHLRADGTLRMFWPKDNTEPACLTMLERCKEKG